MVSFFIIIEIRILKMYIDFGTKFMFKSCKVRNLKSLLLFLFDLNVAIAMLF